MSEEGSLIPISDEQAKLGQEAIKALRGLGGFLEKALGSTPEDVVGYLGGDWLRIRRAENAARMMDQARERLKARGVEDKTEPASLAIALPLLHAAADESRAELVDLWARLLAAAMDPARAGTVRQLYIDIVKRLDPLDARVLEKLADGQSWSPNARDAFAGMFGVSSDAIEVSFRNLQELGVAMGAPGSDFANAHLTAIGREFMRSLRG